MERVSDLERSYEARLAAKDETIATLRSEVRVTREVGERAYVALVDAIRTTAATGPLAAITGLMEFLVEYEVDVPWDELDGDWLSKWEPNVKQATDAR
jgi:hypothetical protein